MTTPLLEQPTRPETRTTAFTTWWRMVWVIVELELRQRLRTTRWKAILATAFAVVSLVVLGSLYLSVVAFGGTYRGWSSALYEILVGFLLFLGIIVAPTLAATTINGDRKDATLAVVQATSITNSQLALGKLIGSWLASLAFVGVAAPYVIWGIVESPNGVAHGLAGVTVLIALFVCYAGIGLGFSAMTTRPAGSAVLTQASVLFLILGLPIVFGLLFPATTQTHTVIRPNTTFVDNPPQPPTSTCREVREDREFHHHEHIWWLLAPNPFFIVADAVAPQRDPLDREAASSVASEISQVFSAVRAGPYIGSRYCSDTTYTYPAVDPADYSVRETAHETSKVGDSWYFGLTFYFALGGIGFWVAARRLRVPAGKLARGVRIA
ncbi:MULTISPECIES: ABC transporter permease [Gordonia]|uniref:ABC transporter permease n=1 Tax=Gordonia TaxID=2053 RepID=UPI002449E253|nr:MULTISPECIES: ABC transporter permease [Gordonia]MDH3009274.1 ABC transporter permease [Gordonia alkanivorans]MDH3010610.1 ABC transporter permease [Gordonia alkanivorans]MDH3043562.1 ABC transporter permease [Gordonia alkanivorans]MDH3048068.1 ABC transporter permease [Gordonia alkanivorans]WJG12432.1 ABC transporter permease [Gordonia sp. Swx-4]